MVEKKDNGNEARVVYDGKNIKIYEDAISNNDGSKNKFYILTTQSDTVGYFRDDKGSLAYGKKPAKALTINKDYVKELQTAVGGLKP